MILLATDFVFGGLLLISTTRIYEIICKLRNRL